MSVIGGAEQRIVVLLRLGADLEIVHLENGPAAGVARAEVGQQLHPRAQRPPRLHGRVDVTGFEGGQRIARHGEHGALRPTEQLRGHASQHRPRDEAAPVRAGGNEIGADALGVGEQIVRRPSVQHH